MPFNKLYNRDNNEQGEQFTEEEIEKIKENSEQMDWSDVLALTIAGIQLLLPMAVLLVISCLIVTFFFFLVWG
ncbi:hypothetical protein [Natranaerobius thermophilus]|uniref:Uncharacterized protein n=1 Tax=Natranaerobius thermophilus (strain ATCC BAA-1301 / DSM 18059 / JW/NM-WN-LF) TaxID=457570 RepID=B2A2X3_NATTJ|nr:hypothetical protein [Natranaerobius thermophilus]ACB86341.1 hypothetical protein Nther_2793 [Natranaerobius thermophilus JW/NM-WN-LF]